jgi:hypothetical protein
MPARNSAWCIGATARALLAWVDRLVVLNHASTDETGEILAAVRAEYADGRLVVLEETNPVWEEMRHRQLLLTTAREQGASHIVMVDDDEILTGNLLPRIREMVLACPAGRILQLPWIQLRGSLDSYISEGQWSSQDVSMAFLDVPGLHWATRNGYDFHHRHPMGQQLVPFQPLGPAFLPFSVEIPPDIGHGRIGLRRNHPGGLMHLQMASYRRLCAKQALYVMQETLRWPGRMTAQQLNEMYGPTVYGGPKPRHQPFEYTPVLTTHTPVEWWDFYDHITPFLHVDEEPWQEAECKRLLAEHGASAFAGLDLYGLGV